jgi:hypothetical protein
MNNGTSYIFAAQPHGVLSFVGMCAAASNPAITLSVPTAAASVVLRTPLLKNLMGIFNLVDASSHNLQKFFLERKSVLVIENYGMAFVAINGLRLVDLRSLTHQK